MIAPRLTAALFCFLLFSLNVAQGGPPVIPAQQPSLKLSPDTKASAMPLRWAAGWPLVQVKINGKDAGWFKIATGWDNSCIDPRAARRLGLVEVPQSGMLDQAVNPSTPAGKTTVYRVDNLHCGAVHADDLWLLQMDCEALSEGSKTLYGEGLSGVIGWDLLRSLPFTLDYGHLELTWWTKFEPGKEAHRDALLANEKLPMIEVVAGEGVKARALVNTAYYTGAMLSRPFAREYAALVRSGRRASNGSNEMQKPADDDGLLTGDFSGDIDDRCWMTLKACGITREVLSGVSKGSEHRYGDMQLGYGWLRRFRMTFDGPAGALWSEAATEAAEVTLLKRTEPGASQAIRDMLWLAVIEGDDDTAVRGLAAMKFPLEAATPDQRSALTYACARSAHAAALALIETGARVNPVRDKTEVTTPLAQAARVGDVELMEALLKAGADPLAPVEQGMTGLMQAALSGSVKAADLMLEKAGLPRDPRVLASLAGRALMGGNVALGRKLWPMIEAGPGKQEYADLMLVWAAFYGRVKSVEWLLDDGGAAPNEIGELPALLAAIIRPLPEKTDEIRQHLVSMLLKKGANPNTTKHGITPLLLAAREGDVKTIEMLLQAGAKGKATDFKGRNALQRAAAANQPAALLAPLLKLGLDLNDTDSVSNRTALGNYAYQGNAAACQVLLDAGADPNVASFREPVLVYACNGPSSSDADALAVTALLLERGAKPSQRQHTQAGPLFGAITSSRSSLIGPLVKAGSSLNQPMFNGVSAVGLAAVVADLATFTKVLELGGEPHSVDQNHQSVVAHAAAAGRVKNLALLLEKGASPNAEKEGDTPPLCSAASSQQLASVKVLLAAKSDPKARDPKTGQTAYAIARARRDEAMMKVLREAGGGEGQ